MNYETGASLRRNVLNRAQTSLGLNSEVRAYELKARLTFFQTVIPRKCNKLVWHNGQSAHFLSKRAEFKSQKQLSFLSGIRWPENSQQFKKIYQLVPVELEIIGWQPKPSMGLQSASDEKEIAYPIHISQEESLAKKWSARQRVRSSRESSPSPTGLKLNFHVHVPILA